MAVSDWSLSMSQHSFIITVIIFVSFVLLCFALPVLWRGGGLI